MGNAMVSETGHFHAVRFYSDPDSLWRIVADFLVEGLAAGQPAIAIATPGHRTGIEAHLTGRGLDVPALKDCGDLFVLDAQDTLAAFMVEGMPDAALFRRAMTPILEAARGARTDRSVRAYGEMVDVLWKADQTAAAIRLETLWNTLANTHAFSLLCGYALGNFYKSAAVSEICSHHSHVVCGTGEVTHAH